MASFEEAFVLISEYLRMLLALRALRELLTELLRWAGGRCSASSQVNARGALPCRSFCPTASKTPEPPPQPQGGVCALLPALTVPQPARSHAQHGTHALQRSGCFRQPLSINHGGVKAGWRHPPWSRASFLGVYTPVSRQIPE